MLHGKCLSLPRPSAVSETKYSSPGCRLVGELRACTERTERVGLRGCERQPVLWGWGRGRGWGTLEEEAWAGDRETSPSPLPAGPRKGAQRPGGHADFPSQEGLWGPISVPRGEGAACPVSSTTREAGGGRVAHRPYLAAGRLGLGSLGPSGAGSPSGRRWRQLEWRTGRELGGGGPALQACTPHPKCTELGAPPGGEPLQAGLCLSGRVSDPVWPFAHK